MVEKDRMVWWTPHTTMIIIGLVEVNNSTAQHWFGRNQQTMVEQPEIIIHDGHGHNGMVDQQMVWWKQSRMVDTEQSSGYGHNGLVDQFMVWWSKTEWWIPNGLVDKETMVWWIRTHKWFGGPAYDLVEIKRDGGH